MALNIMSSNTNTPNEFTFTLSCDDKPGIVAATATELAAIGGNIIESSQFWDKSTNRFFMRISFSASESTSHRRIEKSLKPVIDRFEMRTDLASLAEIPKILIMVSKFDLSVVMQLEQLAA